MFTGIVQETGRLESTGREEGGFRLRLRAAETSSRLAPGGSVAVNGACLTAEGIGAGGFSVFCTRETVDRTNLGRLRAGERVNLELPLRVGDPLGGHWVQGHVDGTVALLDLRPEGGEAWTILCESPEGLRRYIVEKGSVALDGISLTVAGFEAHGGRQGFRVAVIPETWRRTNLSDRRPGDPLHLEVDILAKYVESLLGFARDPRRAPDRISEDFLKSHGFK